MDFDPRQYQDSSSRYLAWMAAGRPPVDTYGRTLDNSGSVVTTGFGADPAQTSQGIYSTNNFLQQFAQDRPWMQRMSRYGGDLGMTQVLSTITQDDFNRYHPQDQELIRRILTDSHQLPNWMQPFSKIPIGTSVNANIGPLQTGPDTGTNITTGTGTIGTGISRNGDTGIRTQDKAYQAPGFTPGMGTQPGTTGYGMGQIPQSLTGLSQSLGNTQGRSSPFRMGQTFQRLGPRGYQGY